jgi:hypothetical protein
MSRRDIEDQPVGRAARFDLYQGDTRVLHVRA